MTTLRGPDPYALAEGRLRALWEGAGAGAEWEGLCAGVCGVLHEAIPTYTCVVVFALGEDGMPVVAGWRGVDDATAWRSLGRDLAGEVAAGGEVVVSAAGSGGDGGGRARAAIAVPLRAGERVRGALVVISEHRGAFGPADRAFLVTVAGALGA